MTQSILPIVLAVLFAQPAPPNSPAEPGPTSSVWKVDAKLFTPADVSRACAADALVLAKVLPPDEMKNIRYLSLSAMPKEQRKPYAGLVNMLVHSLSRKRGIGPIFVGEPDDIFLRINLADYGIDPQAWDKFADIDPYFQELVTVEIVTTTAPMIAPAGENEVDAAIREMLKSGTPVVIFIELPKRDIGPGAIVVSEGLERWKDSFSDKQAIVIGQRVGTERVFKKLAASASNEVIRRTAGLPEQAPEQVAPPKKEPKAGPKRESKTEIASAAWLDPAAMTQLISLTQSRAPLLRADWLLANASLPPFYYDLLNLKKLDDVKELAIFDPRSEKATLAKATIVFSGEKATKVARNNRILGRVSTTLGAYWFTQDFKTSTKENNVIHNLLNENFDGSEIIFSLPNGLHGYFLTDAKGNRVDEVPIEIAHDNLSDDRRVRAARSCIGCHAKGIQPFVSHFQRSIGPGKADLGLRDAALARRIREVYGEPDFASLVKLDQDRYSASVKLASGKTAEANAAAFRQAYDDYAERGLDEVRLVYEAGVADAQVKLAVAAKENGANNGVLLQRLLNLPIRRDQWEESFGQFMRAVLATKPSAKEK